MKYLALATAAFCACIPVASAGVDGSSTKATGEPVATQPCTWYRGHEWEISVWGAYAFPGNQNGNDLRDVAFNHEMNEGADNHEGNIGRLNNDRFLNHDDVGGGGLDIKYFFNKYIGVGVEGYALAANTLVGGALATVTFRYPIGCTPLAPYVFGGAGAAFGGSQTVAAEDNFDNETFFERRVDQSGALFAGAVGGGLEYRLTKRVGIIGDFSWHMLEKPDNNFGMIRSGITFSF
ncbi:MAG: hypothetical protein QOH39_2833 [Verrucomicrobiota bacterium]|jgi:hypothetical protein